MKVSSHNIGFRQILLGFLRLIRFPNLLIIIFTQYFARIFLIHEQGLSLSVLQEVFTDKNLLLIVLATSLIAASGYVINDYYDIKIDLVNKPERVIIGRYIKRRWALAIHQLFNAIGIALGWAVNRKVFIVNIVAVFCLWVYSNRLKRLAFWGNFLISILTGFSLLILAVYYPGHQREVWIYAIFSFAITLVREIIKDMEDVKGDEKHGCRTLPIIWGIAQTKWLLYVFIGFFIVVLFGLSAQLPNHKIQYIFSGMMLPLAYLIYRLVYADKPKDFAFLSHACKLLMLLGVLSMVWA